MIGKGLRICAQAGAGLFKVACADGKPVTIWLEDEPVTLAAPVAKHDVRRFQTGYAVIEEHSYPVGQIDESMVHARAWVQAYYLSSLCREKELIASLCQTPTELLGESSTQAPYYVHTIVDGLKEFAAHDPKAAETFQDVFVTMMDEWSQLASPTYAHLIDRPAVELLLNIQRGEKEEFAKALPRAVESHKKFWSGSKERRQDWDGFLSIPLLGISAVAYDRGFSIDVDSEYLPMPLVRGDFLRGEH